MSKQSPSITISSDNISIPKSNRKDGWAPNPQDLSVTPGGDHFYATTPGGSRIIYDRQSLLKLANSPLSKSPVNLPFIPGVTKGTENTDNKSKEKQTAPAAQKPVSASPTGGDGLLFNMDS
mmetsp:Transcript_16587/g.24740  ORF Transcript_16587/g.24740 Transcript_16587/m.24740 type:complete len:121 (-) Transcript_16587:128-490(-)|eukprot:CAMPEP_0201552676 /NCGR_PEP_ID=MMETSP0173_2-20130828/16853_1 /ASSEMBLY_ACC=CAM_ASM_000268 /TAXON_ID=218659 /ORGANISM="Vexillifera sp., Strain DIVA3 564/2" /LENGTH=120 /DNA_ID=CAMNT_0047963191 /DNA_START=45 /DNA_END=407 /DNA_ORIENTATION=+